MNLGTRERRRPAHNHKGVCSKCCNYEHLSSQNEPNVRAPLATIPIFMRREAGGAVMGRER